MEALVDLQLVQNQHHVRFLCLGARHCEARQLDNQAGKQSRCNLKFENAAGKSHPVNRRLHGS